MPLDFFSWIIFMIVLAYLPQISIIPKRDDTHMMFLKIV